MGVETEMTTAGRLTFDRASFELRRRSFGVLSTSAGTTFKALFAMSKPVATAGASDLFSNSAG